ncbi:MAG: class I SAM-dependent methyltransferase, partial [Anaerolineae bacterium]|nr:class I SAM-dependent methyltransferase [Anaerolineae bacterium]
MADSMSVTPPVADEQRDAKADYFGMLADLGMTKHLGSLTATEDIVEGCHIGPETLVLDVGCGVGLTPCYLVRTHGCRVIGVDITPKMIVRAQEEAQRRGVAERVSFCVADAQALPFPSGHFDVTMVESVSVFLEDPGLGFREYARVVQPGGCVGVTESTWLRPVGTQDDAFMDSLGARAEEKETWLALMAQAGLVDITGYAQPVDLPDEARGRMRRFGCSGILRILLRFVRVLVGSPRARRIYKEALATAP